jgi:tetratricopeptide (TPR) repeat protein
MRRLTLVTPALALWAAFAPLAHAQEKKDPLGNLYGDEDEEGAAALPEEPLPRARAFLASGRHDEALALLLELRKGQPSSLQPLLPLARLYLKTGQDAEAARCAARILELDPKRSAGHLVRGILAEGRGDLKAAASAFAKAIELGPRSAAGLEALVRRAVLTSEIDARRSKLDLRAVLEYYGSKDELSATEFTWIARACRAIDLVPELKAEYSRSFVKYSRRMLDQALGKDRDYGPAHLEAGVLALMKVNHPLAKKSFERVVKHDPNGPEGRVGLARALLASFYGGAGKYKHAAQNLKIALSVNPHYAGAHATLARIAVMDGDHGAALERVATGLRARPADVELLAVKAAVQLLRGQTKAFEASAKAVLAKRPRCARFFEEIATLVQMKFRYAEARDLARRALSVDPGYHPALAILGVNLTRTGEEKEGRRVLRRAFQEDPFNVFVFNHLQLWDRLDKHYVTVEIPGGTLRLHKDEKDVTTRYVVELVEEARQRLGKKYGGVPKRVLIELFPAHADFSARSVGLPGIPALGVCFGPVVTVISGKEKRAFGAHSWGRTLWHEYAHVCTLTRTGNRVPRWLTEGLSVYEEPRGKVTWQREYDADLMTLMARGLILPIARLDEGFTKPRYPNQVIMSYYQGGMICEFIDARWGFKKVLALLDAFRDGLDTSAAVKRALGVSASDFDARFYRFLERRYSRYAWQPPPSLADRRRLSQRVGRAPWDVAARGQLAWVLAIHGKDADAAAEAGLTLRHAAALLPELGRLEGAGLPGFGARILQRAAGLRAGAADAHLCLGIVSGRRGKLARARRHIRRALQLGTRDPVRAHLLLSDIHRARKQWKLAVAELEIARRLSPPKSELLRRLAALHKEAGDTPARMAALREVCRLDSDDARVRVAYAKWAKKQGRWVEVADVLDDVNLIDPFLKSTHLLLGDALRKTALGDKAKIQRALGEYEVAVAVKVDYLAGAYFGQAACLVELGRRQEALALVRKALSDDPEHTEARLLKTKLEQGN